MYAGNRQREEISTIKERTIKIELSDADVRRLAIEAAKGGISVELLLQNFIGDLVDGTYSNGSDERDFARRWYDRCWFGGYSDADTLLQVLARDGLLDYALDLWDEHEKLLEDLRTVVGSEAEEMVVREQELQEELQSIAEPFDSALGWNEVLAWREKVNQLMQGE